MKRFTAVAAFVVLIAVAIGLAQYHLANLANVQRVYVDKLGNNDDAERFRSQLASELGQQGFTPMEQAEGADGIVKGTFSFRDFGNKSGAAANLHVVNPEGKELWSISANDPKPDRQNESAQWVAHEVAKKMKEQKAKDSKGKR